MLCLIILMSISLPCIVTFDNIINNYDLRNLFVRGPKYRERKNLNIVRNTKNIMSTLEEYVEKHIQIHLQIYHSFSGFLKCTNPLTGLKVAPLNSWQPYFRECYKLNFYGINIVVPCIRKKLGIDSMRSFENPKRVTEEFDSHIHIQYKACLHGISVHSILHFFSKIL